MGTGIEQVRSRYRQLERGGLDNWAERCHHGPMRLESELPPEVALELDELTARRAVANPGEMKKVHWLEQSRRRVKRLRKEKLLRLLRQARNL